MQSTHPEVKLCRQVRNHVRNHIKLTPLKQKRRKINTIIRYNCSWEVCSYYCHVSSFSSFILPANKAENYRGSWKIESATPYLWLTPLLKQTEQNRLRTGETVLAPSQGAPPPGWLPCSCPELPVNDFIHTNTRKLQKVMVWVYRCTDTLWEYFFTKQQSKSRFAQLTKDLGKCDDCHYH